MSTQNVNVARFAGNVECDFLECFFKHCDFTYYACTCCHCWQISFHRSHIDKAFLQYEYWCVLERPAWWQNLCYKFCIGKVLRDPLYEIWSCGSSFGSWGQVFHKKCKVTFHVPFEYAENKYIFEIYKCNFVIYKCNFENYKCNIEIFFRKWKNLLCSDRIVTWFGMGSCDILKMADLQVCIFYFPNEFSNGFHYWRLCHKYHKWCFWFFYYDEMHWCV